MSDRDHRGRFVKGTTVGKGNVRTRFANGNTLRVTHGLTSRAATLERLMPDAPTKQDRIDKLTMHLGGAPSEVQRELLPRFATLLLVCDYLEGHINGGGVLTTKGNTRACVSTYLQTVDRVVRMSQLIGVHPRAKQVTFEDLGSTEGE